MVILLLFTQDMNALVGSNTNLGEKLPKNDATVKLSFLIWKLKRSVYLFVNFLKSSLLDLSMKNDYVVAFLVINYYYPALPKILGLSPVINNLTEAYVTSV